MLSKERAKNSGLCLTDLKVPTNAAAVLCKVHEISFQQIENTKDNSKTYLSFGIPNSTKSEEYTELESLTDLYSSDYFV